jgi:multidrug efflux pump subunit AcrA (membrane-fusion protein)
VRFPATNQTLEARLTRVVAAMDPHTRTFAAIAELPNKDHALRSGLYAEVTLGGSEPRPPMRQGQGRGQEAGARQGPRKD